jgi:uncharacterized repeat protein (TIGR01451 family)
MKTINTLEITETTTVQQALQIANNSLSHFASSADFNAKMQLAFGNHKIWEKADLIDFPTIEIRPAAEINNARGAFAAATNTIYLSQELVNENSGNVEAIASVLLEEYGHYIDAKINAIDSPGDEGELFADLVQGKGLSQSELLALKTEDDSTTIILDGKTIGIEQAEVSDSGGFERSQETLKLDSKGGGIARFSYEMFQIPDNLIFRYEGNNILDTGFVSGNQTGKVEIPKGNSDEVQVVLATNDEGTEWNYTVSTARIYVDSIKFADRDVATGIFEFLPTFGSSPNPITTDGNKVQITATIKNTEDTDKTVEISAEEVESKNSLTQPQTVTIPAGQSKEVKFEWDTNGYAWKPNKVPGSDREVKIFVKEGGKELDSDKKGIRVLPKPVILVQGAFNSEFDQTYSSYLKAENPDWKGVVAPSIQTDPKSDTPLDQRLDTGDRVIPPPFPNVERQPKLTIDNALALNNFIESKRQGVAGQPDAQQVDILAYSQGGLISRQYIHSYMENNQEGKPKIAHLLMLGTPNGGSALADGYQTTEALSSIASILLEAAFQKSFPSLPNIPATNELSEEYVTNVFNQEVTNTKGVPFSVLAGNALPTYTTSAGGPVVPGDFVVTFDSARTGIPDVQTTNSDHIFIQKKKSDFDSFVLPRLAIPPSNSRNQTSLPQKMASLTANASEPTATNKNVITPQLVFSDFPKIPAGGSIDIDIPSPTGTTLNVGFIASNSVSATLLSPTGAVIATSKAGTPESSLPFRSVQAQNPVAGTYKLRLEQQEQTPVDVPVTASITGNPLVLDLSLGTPNANKQVLVSATLKNGGSPVTDATVEAGIVGIDTNFEGSISLFDNGQNGDVQAGDGIYSNTTNSLESGAYTVSVAALGSDFVRATSNTVNIPGLVRAPAPPVAVDFSDLSLSTTTSPIPANLGDKLTYNLTVTNNGPAKATGVTLTDNLPSAVKDVSVTSSKGTVAPSNSVVTAELGDLNIGESATLTITSNSIGAGNLTHTASVSSNESDPNQDNNSITESKTVNPVVPAPVDLELAKTVSNPNPNVGDQITFTLTLTNKGPGVASSIKVADILPPGLSFISANSIQGTYDSNTGIWDVGNMRDNLTRTLDISAQVNTPGSIITNAALLSLGENDINPTNNQTSLTINPIGSSSSNSVQKVPIVGTPGNDYLVGTFETDFIYGWAGNDILIGGLGQDILGGGPGFDTFVLPTKEATANPFLADTIVDFQLGVDRIGLTDGLTASNLALIPANNHTAIQIAANNQTLGVVAGVSPNQLTNSFVGWNSLWM